MVKVGVWLNWKVYIDSDTLSAFPKIIFFKLFKYEWKKTYKYKVGFMQLYLSFILMFFVFVFFFKNKQNNWKLVQKNVISVITFSRKHEIIESIYCKLLWFFFLSFFLMMYILFILYLLHAVIVYVFEWRWACNA